MTSVTKKQEALLDEGAALLGRRPSDVVMGAEPSSTRAVEGALW